MIWAVVRGNLTEAAPHTPQSVDDGIVSQLLLTSDGRKEIHCAMIVPAPAERVWATVTDYDHFAEIFPHISASKGAHEADGRWHLTGEVKSLIGRWTMDVHVQQEERGDKFIASWDEPSGALKVNRGNWTVTRQGPEKTLLEYNLELEASPFPGFMVRAVLLDQLKPVMAAVATRAQQKPSP